MKENQTRPNVAREGENGFSDEIRYLSARLVTSSGGEFRDTLDALEAAIRLYRVTDGSRRTRTANVIEWPSQKGSLRL